MKTKDPVNLSLKNRLSFLAKDSLLYGGAAALNKVFSLSTFPLLARYFSVSDYGIIDIFMVFTSFLTIFFVFGQDSAVARYFYEYKDDESKKELISQSLIWQSFFLIVALPLLWYNSSYLASMLADSRQANEIMKLNLIQIPFMLIINFSQNLLKWTFSRKKFLLLSLGSVFTNMVFLLLGVFIFNLDISDVFVAALITQVIFGCLGFYYIREWLIVPSNFKFLRELILYALPYGIICCLGSFIPTMERSLVSDLLGNDDLGKYAAGSKVAMLMSLVVQSFQTAWGPFSLSIHKKNDALQTYNWVLKLFVIIVCMAVLGLSLIADYVLIFLATNRYAGASVIVFPLAMGMAIQATSWVTEIGIGISKRSYLYLYGYFAFVAVSWCSIYFFAQKFGLFGVALGVLVGQIVKAFLTSYLSYLAYPLSWAYRPVLGILIVTCALGLFAMYLGAKYSSLYLSSLAFTLELIFLPTASWFIIFEQHERSMISTKIRVLLSRYCSVK